MRVVSFVAASSNSGKTTLIEKIVRILRSRGLRVGVMKHASAGFELDKPGKDSWRFQEAGADTVILVGPEKLALIKRITEMPDYREIGRMAADTDILITEGFKRDAKNKIEVFRSDVSGEQPLCLSDHSFLALVSDKSFDVSIPRFDLNDAEGVVKFILNLNPNT